uniref:Retrovirus-related Pol polyprotein from transposon TNT 1-94 n=1 Tax=Tanacetum cinerariifolium TaxID=118510 RepID=A0A6L2LKV5_TANCI|nr:retrovirus-related Pol polyprotein from transposon TNT 1-94 [Tanacetum cinerariifolium]
MMVSILMTFLSANPTEYLVSTVGGTVSLKGLILAEVRLLLTRFHVLAIISSFASTSAGGKDRPPMLAPGNNVQWKSRIKRYIDTKPNHVLIYYCLKNPPYEYTWADKTVPVSEGSSETTTERYMENYKNVSQDIRDQLNVEAKAVQIILTEIDNDIYSTVDACPNACEMWKAIERLKQEWQRFVTLVKQNQELKTVSYHKLYDILKQHQNEVNEIRAERLACTTNPLALVAQQQPVYHSQNHPTHYTQNSSTRSQQADIENRGKAIVNSPTSIYDQEPSMVAKDDEIGTGYDNQRIVNVAGARETVGTTMVQKSRIQCYNCKELGHVARDCPKLKRAKDATYHKEKMLLDDTDDELEDQELEAHYMYMAQIQEVNLDDVDNSGPIFDTEPLQKNDDDDDLSNERELLASLIEKLKCEIDDRKNRNKFLETSNKVLVDKLKGEIEDFKTKNKSLESSNNRFKEANNKLSETNELMYNDLKKFQAELDRYNDVKYASKVEIDYAKAKGDLLSYKMEFEKSSKKMVADLRYFNSLELEVNSLRSQLETQKTQFLNEIGRLSREYYYADHMNAILGVYTELDEVTNLQCTVKFGNDQIAPVLGYGDLVQGAVTIKRVYYVERLNHNLFSVGQFCDADLEVAFRKSTSYICDLKGNDLLTGSPWLWHRRLSHLNFNTINLLSKNDIVIGLPKLKFVKDHLYSSCKLGKAKRKSFQTKTTPSSKRRLQLLHMDLCGPMRVECINGKKYVLLIVDDYSRYTWTHFLTSKDETPEVLIDFLRLVQRGLHAQAEAIATTCFTQNRSLIIPRHEKTPYHVINDQKPSVKFFYIFGSLCYIIRYGNFWLWRSGSGAVIIKRVYYVEGLNHNLFSIGQFFDADLEVAFRKSTCYICDLKGNDLLAGSRDIVSSMVMASSSVSFELRHINLLSKNDIVVGLPKLKFVKDHLCSSCELRKAKRKSFLTKLTPSSKRRLQLLHIDLCGPMRVASINGKRYVLVIVDDYSRYTWTHFVRSKDETLDVLIDFLRLVQRGLQAQVRLVRTDKGTEILNQTLHAYFAVEAIAIACFTQNHALVIPRHEKTPYHIINDRKPSVKFFHMFGSTCYIVRDGENLDKMKERGDECIFVGYSTESRAYRVFNKRTRVIMESIHVNFDELPQMASDQLSSDPAPEYRTVTTSNELDLLFSPMFDELLNGSSKVVSKSSAVSVADAPIQRQHHTTPLNNHTTHTPTCQILTLAPIVISSENINQAETHAENDQVADDEFINIFSTLSKSLEILYNLLDISFELTAFSDSDHVSCLDSRKITSGGTGIETVVYANSDHAGDYVDQKSTSEFAQILDIPYEGACVFTDKWSLDELAYGVPTDGPYQTNPPSPDDIILSIRINREGQVRRTRHEEEIDVLEYQILAHEIVPTLKSLKEITQENSESQERIVAQEEVVTLRLLLSPLTNHPPHILMMMMMMMEMTKGPRVPLIPQPLQSHPSLDITLSLSPITPLDHIHDTSSPPSPPQPQPPIMGHPLYYNYHDYHRKLSLETLKPTKMSVRLADQSFQCPIRIAKNMLVKVGKFTFLVDFIILEMKKDSKVPLILGRPFLHTADAVILVKQKQLNLGVGTERMTFSIDYVMKHSYSNDDTCFSIDVIDEILEEDFDSFYDKWSEILHYIEGTILEEKLFAEFMAMNIKENSEPESDKEEPTFEKNHL